MKKKLLMLVLGATIASFGVVKAYAEEPMQPDSSWIGEFDPFYSLALSAYSGL